ncbi:site-specific integrase [Enterococcus hirae]|nr:site-specific integrase [Enterococcus hirae]
MAQIKPYKKQDGTINYMFDFYVGINPKSGKKQKTTRRGFKTEEEASLALAELSLLVATEQYVPKKHRTFNEIFTLWYKQYRNLVKESTAVTAKSEFKYAILPKFQEMRIQDITPIYCQQVVNEWYKDKPKRASRFIYYFNRVMEHALFLELIYQNPMANVKKPVTNLNLNQYEEFSNFFTKEELIEFLRFTKENFDSERYAFFRTLAFTGLRKGEAFALTWEDINFDEKYLEVTKTVAKGERNKTLIHPPKTKAGFRRISLDNTTLVALKIWQEKQAIKFDLPKLNPNQIIFSNYKNTYLESGITKEWFSTIQSLYRKKTGKEIKTITIHGFRHTHASLLYKANIPIKEAQERLGHSNVKTTLNIYTHLSKDQRDKTASRFAEFMNEI